MRDAVKSSMNLNQRRNSYSASFLITRVRFELYLRPQNIHFESFQSSTADLESRSMEFIQRGIDVNRKGVKMGNIG